MLKIFTRHLRQVTFLLFFLLIAAVALPSHAGATNYVNSVQQGTVTIASGATTGTATITAVADTAVLLYNGCATTATTSLAQATAKLSISGTTVTATRKTSSTNTVTCKFTVIDADSTNLVKSVQYGSFTWTTSNTITATISAVTTANTVIVLLGTNMGTTTFQPGENLPLLSLTNTTTVSGKCSSFATSLTANFVAIEFQGSALNQPVQFFSKNWTSSSTTTTQAITSVNVNNAAIFYAGYDNVDDETNFENQTWAQITGATVVTLTTGVATGDPDLWYNGFVVEFVSGVLSQSAQHGSVTIPASSASGTATPTSAAVTLSALNWTGFATSNTAATSAANVLPNASNTAATTITGTVSGTVPAAKTVVQGYDLLTFTTGGGPPPSGYVHSMGAIF